MKISYREKIGDARVVASEYFEGWASPPSQVKFVRMMENSDIVVLAIDDDTGAVVGLVTCITDTAVSAYIPYIEVRPKYRSLGIGSELMRRMLTLLHGVYMIDVVCDEELVGFYKQFGFERATAMSIRDYSAADEPNLNFSHQAQVAEPQ